MSAISLKSFKGEVPRIEPHLLGNENARQAYDCDFVSGSLRPVRDGFKLTTLTAAAGSVVRGIYTEDGINFFSWQSETQAFQSPVIDDTFGRVYYLTPSEGIFRVADKIGMTPFGPTPGSLSRWSAGVPRPTVAPALLVFDRTTLPDYPSTSLAAEHWWEDASGKTYNRATAGVTTNTALKVFTITKPPIPDDLEVGDLRLVVKFSIKNSVNNSDILSATVKAASTSRSSSLPGGVELSLDDQPSSSTARMTLTWGTFETRAYTYTYINTWNEESAPSPAATASLTYIQNVQVTVTAGTFTGYRPFSKYQIYRTFGSNPSYLPIEMVSPGPVFVDGYTQPWSAGEALQSTNWTPPPVGLQGLDISPNGWFLAFKGNTLYMSEPYRPHAWPYNMTFPKTIRGIKVAQQSVIVTTMDGVYMVGGAVPGATQQVKLSTPQPGISQRSMVSIDGAVAYASNDGFILVEGSRATPDVSQKLFDRDTWRSRYASQLGGATPSMRFAYHDGSMVSVPDNENDNGFMFGMDEDAGSFTRLKSRYDAMFPLPVNDALYYSIGKDIYQFQGGGFKTFDWWSKDFVFPNDVGFGAGYIRCSGSVTMTVYREDVVYHSAAVTTGHFRLPANGRGRRWSVRLQGAGAVMEFMIASSMGELQGV